MNFLRHTLDATEPVALLNLVEIPNRITTTPARPVYPNPKEMSS